MIVVRDEIQAIINSIKSSGTVDSFTDNLDGTYTIITSDIGNLQAGFKINLIYSDSSLNKSFTIDSLTATTITFAGANLTAPDSWEMALYFESGSRTELNKKYNNKAKSDNKYINEFPLIWLYSGYERRPSDFEAAKFETTLQFALVNPNLKDKYEETRIEDNFKPILYPYLELINEAFNNEYKYKFVLNYGESELDFIELDRPFFGSADQNANVLPQPSDAIEFQVDLRWRIESGVCSPY